MVERDILICECHSLEHQYAFWFDDDEKQLYCEPHLITDKNFFGRLIHGIKYIFGYKSKFGAWDEFIFKEKDLAILKKHIDKII